MNIPHIMCVKPDIVLLLNFIFESLNNIICHFYIQIELILIRNAAYDRKMILQ